MRCRKENVRTAAGNDRACQSDLLSAAFEVQRCKGDEVKSTLCLCDLFSHHFFYGGCCEGARQAGILAACTMGSKKKNK